jgi:L-Ala-D/L-Glu epimerase
MSMNCIIQQIELYKLLIPLKEPFVISLGPVNNAESVIVRIRTSNGITGFGECSPYTSINGESIDTCFIVGQYFAKVLVGKDALKIKSCLKEIDKVIYGNNSIKSAFDMALYDIAAQDAAVPLYKFLKGKNDKTITTDMTVGLADKDKMAADAKRFMAEGFPAIKVKLGESMEKDVERIAAIRDAVGKDIPLRIDANQGWKVKTAIETLNALEEFNIEHCEEPIARWNYMRLRKVRKNSPIPIMADESCGDHHDAKRLIELEACDSLNIKLGKSGGICNAMKIIRLADAASMPMQIGAFMESRLGITAAAHLALTNDRIVHFDFDTPLMFTEDPVSAGVKYMEHGVVKITEQPGLGATIDESWLKKMESASFS